MWGLIITFLKIGLLTFGGGSAAVPIIDEEVIQKNRWLNKHEFHDIVTLANILPGPSMIEMASFIGHKKYQKTGAVMAAIAISCPSMLLFTIVMLILSHVISPDVIYLITVPIFLVIGISMYLTSYDIYKNNTKNLKKVIQIPLIILTFLAITYFNIHPTVIILTVIIAVVLKEVMFSAN